MAQTTAKRPTARAARSLVGYDDDLCAWAEQQVALLRARRFDELDAENVAEELSGVSKSERWKLWSTLRVLVMHMLKWDQQPEFRTPSWVHSIREQRRRYEDLLKTSPSLKSKRDDVLADIYPLARGWASDETSIPEDEFPSSCPYTWEDILHRPFEVDAAARRPR